MKKLALLLALSTLPNCLRAQTGIPPFSSNTAGGFDSVNNAILNAYFNIPIFSDSGRGMPLQLGLSYNSTIWQSGASWTPVTDSAGNATWGWQKDMPPGGSASYYHNSGQVKCFTSGSNWYWATINYYASYVYVDPLGTGHRFPNHFNVSSCARYNDPLSYRSGYASDSSGYYLNAINPTAPIVTSVRGTEQVNGAGTAVDANGNYVTKTVVSSTETDWTDSVGNVALKIIYSPNQTSPTTIQYQFLDGTGASSYKTITLKLQSYSIKTIFGCSGVGEYNGTAYLPYEMDIPSPNGGSTNLVYTFIYEGTPNNPGYYTGRLLKVTLPTGGSYEYDYPQTAPPYGINCADGTTVSMNRVVSDGTNTATWNFVRNTSNLTTTATTPQLADTPNANDTVYTFNSSGQETSRQIYANSPGTTLSRTINTTWATNGTPATQITILEDNSTKAETDTTFDSNGLLDSIAQYDWGTGAHGSANPIRTTTYSYQTSTNYTSRNIINLVTSKIIKDGSGTTQHRQDITYDGVSLANCPTGVPQHDDANYGCTMNYRGNPTSVTTYLTPATPANGVTKNFTYDVFGNLLTAQLNCCQNKTWTYSVATQYSQPDSITRGSSPTQLTTSATYNAYTGLVATSTDENSQVTNYYYDFLRRPTSVVRQADSATVTYTYDDVHFTATIKSPIDSAKSVQQVTAADGLGRTITSTTEDGSGNIISIVSAQYDLPGRAFKTSNPYTGSPSYWTTTQFDVLGRPISVTLPDNSATAYSYATNTATVTDPTLKQRKSQSDAAGRLAIVFEPDPTNGNQLTLQTSYTYTVLDALATVTQGSQTRTYVYDALGRINSATTPESGTVCLGSVSGSTCNADGYDSFDNLQKRTDARGVLTTYGYDGLNRLTSVSYNVGTTGVPATPGVTLTYGSNAAQFNNGRLITMTDGVGSENYAYNNLGQMTQLQKVISGTTFTTAYGYNTASELTQITYPSSRVVQQSVDAIGRLCEIAPATSGCGTASSPYATGYGYNAASQPTGFKYGNGIFASFGFSSDRLQLNCLDYSTTNRSGNCTHDSTTKFGLSYSYGAAGSNNGQIAGFTDSVDSGRSATYTYDALYRLTTAVTTGSTGYPAWGLSESYDRYGNRSAQSIYSGCSGVACPTNSVTPDTATNRISGYSYDANGNMTNDGSNTLVYDGENHAVSATNGGNSGAYTYDGNGLRVIKVSGSTTTVYIFLGSKVIAEYDNGAAPSSPSREYVYSGGALLARIDSSGTKYYHQDQLSSRLVTDSSGNTSAQLGHFPFGESWYNASNDKLLFTTYERDAESGNDYVLARSYVNRLARFSSADPLSGSASDPQSLNRYDYVADDPTDLVDPDGLCPNWSGTPFAPAGKVICTSARPIADGPLLGGMLWIDVLGSSWDLNLEWGTWQFFPIYGPSGAGGIVGGTGGGEPQKKQSEKEKKKSDCFAELKFNEAGHGTPSGVTHSFWYLQNSRGNQYIVTAGPTNPSGKGGNYGALNVWPIQVTNSTMNSGPNKASDVTHWSTGSSPDNCDAVDKLLAAANAFPNNSIPYSPLGPNSNSAARTLGSVAGFSPAAPPGAWGWSVPIHP